jgi:hypothetical protein
MATVTDTERVSVEIIGYSIQRSDWNNGHAVWVLCYTIAGYDVGSMSHSVPCTYDSRSEALTRLNQFREDHPASMYRMVRYMTITEVEEV